MCWASGSPSELPTHVTLPNANPRGVSPWRRRGLRCVRAQIEGSVSAFRDLCAAIVVGNGLLCLTGLAPPTCSRPAEYDPEIRPIRTLPNRPTNMHVPVLDQVGAPHYPRWICASLSAVYLRAIKLALYLVIWVGISVARPITACISAILAGDRSNRENGE